ncbi:MAG: GNAT family N-acetyltransferase [Cyanobacteria bacterium SZAS LIN-2]|nr:GNAT family N-acetyltransferase [Cyanobacteria bacterium SZAS LIN-3]MBS1997625.1 GNAT family N-acetyltransferase [Cyanobacteria bacterium SZAS LIN-2]
MKTQTKSLTGITITEGFEPGAIGEITALHGHYYAREWGLNERFEAQVAAGLADFAMLLMDQEKQAKNRQWLAKKDGRVVGAIAIQEDSPAGTARLRRFIVADEVRGTGLGNRLMDTAMRFCREAGYDTVFLWTYLGLDQARHLYEKHGFVLVEQKAHTDWGRPVTYVRFKCPLKGPTLTISRAGADDRAAAKEIVDEYCQSIGVLHRDSESEFEKYFEGGSGVWLARTAQGEVAGCILLRPLPQIENACEVKRLYVKPQYRGLCAADAMLGALHKAAAAAGYKWCYLDTKDDLKAAIRFYQRHGYVDCQRYNDNEQATIFMRRNLT